MIELVRREFIVDAPLEKAWTHLAQIEQWPSWAKHIKHVELSPPGEITSSSTGSFQLTNGINSQFTVTELQPLAQWKWRGPFLWLRIDYDHLFESLPDGRTRFTWIVEGEGFGTRTLGRLFAWQYNRNLDRAVPLLQKEMAGI